MVRQPETAASIMVDASMRRSRRFIAFLHHPATIASNSMLGEQARAESEFGCEAGKVYGCERDETVAQFVGATEDRLIPGS